MASRHFRLRGLRVRAASRRGACGTAAPLLEVIPVLVVHPRLLRDKVQEHARRRWIHRALPPAAPVRHAHEALSGPPVAGAHLPRVAAEARVHVRPVLPVVQRNQPAPRRHRTRSVRSAGRVAARTAHLGPHCSACRRRRRSCSPRRATCRQVFQNLSNAAGTARHAAGQRAQHPASTEWQRERTSST
jgi:hypothetical protein